MRYSDVGPQRRSYSPVARDRPDDSRPMPKLTPPDPSALLETAAELNALSSVDETLPLLVERMRELVGADTASVISWDPSRTVGRVSAASGFASERVGELTRSEESLPRIALERRAAQYGPIGPSGFVSTVDGRMRQLQRAVSVPVFGGERPITLQAGWLEAVPEDTLSAAA